MRLSAILFLITLSSACSTIEYRNVPVFAPAAPYVGTVKRASIIQCPRPVQEEVYRHLKSRDDYVETLLSVIEIHNGGGHE